jgi:hypothetical protein
LTQPRFSRKRGDQLDVGAGEIDRCRCADEIFDFGRNDDAFEGNLSNERVINVAF